MNERKHGSCPRIGRRVAAGAVASLLLAATACAGPPPAPFQHQPQDRAFTRDVYDCLHASRLAISGAITSGMAQKDEYNACMRERGRARVTDLPEVAAAAE